MSPIRDYLNDQSPETTQQAAFTLLDQIQGIQPKGLQVSAVAFLFILMCERFRIDPREVLDKTHKVLRDSLSQGRGEYVRAIRNYVEKEL